VPADQPKGGTSDGRDRPQAGWAGPLLRLEVLLGRIVLLVTAAGALTVLAQALWISYGVFVRYVLNAPDRYVTEATALLLVPVAFAGMAYALKEDAFPKVTMAVDTLPPRIRSAIETINLVLMLAIGVFFTIVTGSAAIRTYFSGASTDVLRWPEFLFWIPVAISIGVFDLYAFVRLLVRLGGIGNGEKAQGWSGT
jgi:TRAP-type C4-dicarboxylate transport system permease small subunit